jgi:hypothetical protein
MVPFDDDRVVALRDDRAVPNRFWHQILLERAGNDERSAQMGPMRFERRRAVPQGRAGRSDVIDEHNLATRERSCVAANIPAAGFEPRGAAAPALRVGAGSEQDRSARQAAVPLELAGEEEARIVSALQAPCTSRRDRDEDCLRLDDRSSPGGELPREREADRPAAAFEGENGGPERARVGAERETGQPARFERDARTLQREAAFAKPGAAGFAPGAARRIEDVEESFERCSEHR